MSARERAVPSGLSAPKRGVPGLAWTRTWIRPTWSEVGRVQVGGTTSPRLTAMTNITIPVVVHRTSESTDDSTPKSPPLR